MNTDVEDLTEIHHSTGRCQFFDHQRRHSTLGYKTPVDYDGTRPNAPAVAA
jgi:hypothetical protein